MNEGMRLMPEHKSHKVLSMKTSPMEHGNVNWPGSFIFVESSCCRSALHSARSATMSICENRSGDSYVWTGEGGLGAFLMGAAFSFSFFGLSTTATP